MIRFYIHIRKNMIILYLLNNKGISIVTTIRIIYNITLFERSWNFYIKTLKKIVNIPI